MPIYSFKNKDTEEYFEQMMSYDDKLKYLEDNPNIESVLTIPTVGYNDAKKPDDGFRDILKSIKTRNPGSQIDTY